MASLISISTYRPCWEGPQGQRVAGMDEDIVTMAAVAAQGALGQKRPERVVVVSRQIASAPPSTTAVLAVALGLGDVSIQLRLGGAPATVDALATAAPGTLVVAVETVAAPSAAAALIGEGTDLRPAGRVEHGFPVGESAGIHDDPRLIRERAWRPAVEKLAAGSGGTVIVAGPSARATRGLADGTTPGAEGAPAPLAALAELAAEARVIGLEGGSAAAIDSEPCPRVTHNERTTRVVLPLPPAPGGEIPISLSAFERAFDSKIGLQAGRCTCGALSLPPRLHCLECGADGAATLEPLPRRGEVYSAVTIHAPLPGKSAPYSLAVVDIEGVPLRVLAPVTDAAPGTTPIGTHGELVLRRLAERQGIPDYGYAFQPHEEASA
jgi:uncharacterized OB-fold protein